MAVHHAFRKRRSFLPSLEWLDERIVPANIFEVTTTANSGAGSLRAAIISANSTANVGGPDEIHFNISGAGPHTINLLTPLDTITQAVLIDGFTQTGASPNTDADGNDAVILIELNGVAVAADNNGLSITGNG